MNIILKYILDINYTLYEKCVTYALDKVTL